MAESNNMSISVNGQSQVPPGFRFHPTEEELLQYYLKKKVSNLRIDLDVICDIDLNKLEPWDIQERCRIGTTPQNDWYFFSHKDRKYPTGTRTNRATAAGFWKATGRDKPILSNCRRIGMRKTLVFYKGRAPHGRKSDWIMHEYRLDDNTTETINNSSPSVVVIESTQEEGWVVCRIFKKKNHHKTRDRGRDESPVVSSVTAAAEAETTTEMISMFEDSGNGEEGALEQIFQCMRPKKYCKEETNNINNCNDNNIDKINGLIMSNESEERFLKLPRLESPNSQDSHQTLMSNNNNNNSLLSYNYHHDLHQNVDDQTTIANWTALDRLVASQLNGQTTSFFANSNDDHDCDQDHLQVLSHHVALQSSISSYSFNSVIKPNNIYHNATQDYSNEIEQWGFARSSSSYSSSDPLCHVSNGPRNGIINT